MTSREERTEKLATNLDIFVCEAHIFTSDAILLADFCKPRHKDKCCDLGTGNGIIPLMLAKSNANSITGLEIQVENVELADEIKKKMFLFEDIVKLDDKSIQRVLKELLF